MSFVTLSYLLLMSLVFCFYFTTRKATLQNLVLLTASYVFYAWWDYRFSILVLFSSVLDYVCGLQIDRAEKPAQKRRWLWLSLAGNFGILGFFKYFSFFVESAVDLAQSLGFANQEPSLSIILPVGISFYTFQTASYTIDIYRGRMKPTRDFLSFCTFVVFFPQLVAGPIERASSLLPQFLKPRGFCDQRARDGLRRILWGFFKKVCVADVLSWTIGNVYSKPDAFSGTVLLLMTICFALQIYADFSGYSDIAIGSAAILGIGLTQNFNTPYFSTSLTEFWHRWHITLSTWFRDDVYIPLGGNRLGTSRTNFNILATFVLSGLWHGANWTFVIWGGLHGFFLVVEKSLGQFKNRWLGWLATSLIVLLSWVFFRADSLAVAVLILQKIVIDSLLLDLQSVVRFLSLWTDVGRGLLATAVMLTLEMLTSKKEHPLQDWGVSRPIRWVGYSFLFWWIVIVTPVMDSPFLYFQF